MPSKEDQHPTGASALRKVEKTYAQLLEADQLLDPRENPRGYPECPNGVPQANAGVFHRWFGRYAILSVSLGEGSGGYFMVRPISI